MPALDARVDLELRDVSLAEAIKTLASATGNASISPSRNSTLSNSLFRAFSRARANISGELERLDADDT